MGQCCSLVSAGFPGTRLVSSHFIYFLYVTGVLVGGLAYVFSPCRPFQLTLLTNHQFLPVPQSPLFLQPEVMGVYLPGAGTLGCAVCPGAGIAHSQGVPPDFYLPHVNVGLPLPPLPLLLCPPHLFPNSVSPPLLPVWMNMASLHPWLSDFHTFRFSGSSGCYLF